MRDEVTEHPINMEEAHAHKSTNFDSWSCLANGRFVPSYPSVKGLPAGFYDIDWIDEARSNGLIKKEMKLDELYHLPSPEIIDIIDDIKNFWESKEKFTEYRFIHKRGILLYGDPGCGKSGIIQLCTQYLIEEMDGIVINIKDGDAVERYVDFIPDFRKIETDRPIIVIMEDIDSIAGEDRHSTSKILNILDGMSQIDNVVYIATTNYPEKLEERITNRPSRFDRRYRVELPNAEIRESYFKSKLKKEDLKKINLKEWVQKSDGMSLAHLRELVISVIAMRNDFQETIDRLNGMQIKPLNKKRGHMGFGK
jgi:SpoVK/Ycf46/Vps4 family AAA+-type ATPase